MPPEISADILSMPIGPALSATSDAPVITPAVETPAAEAPNAKTIPAETEAAETLGTGEGGEGEAGEEGAGEAAPAVAPPETKPRPVAPRMAELTAARKLAEERTAAADARADKLAGTLETALAALNRLTPTPADAPPEAPEPKPQRETFADPDSYDTALVEWSARTATRLAAAEFERKASETRQEEETERETKAREERGAEVQRQNEALAATWQDRRAAAIEAHPDFAEIAEADTLQVPMTMVPALLFAENGPEVLYHLGKNPDEAVRIAALNPLQQAIEIGKISAILAQPVRARAPTLPPPTTPVGARNNAAPKDPNEMTTEEYAAKRLPVLQGERRATMWGTPRAN